MGAAVKLFQLLNSRGYLLFKKTMLLLAVMLLSVPFSNASQTFRNVYSVTAVDTTTPLEVLAESAETVLSVSIFDSSGRTMELLVDGDRALLIPPGGDTFKLGINRGALVELRAVSATASSGEIDINFF